MSEKTYNILRFYFLDYPTKVIKENVSLEEAQAHCQDPSTSGTDENGDLFFDGYTEVGSEVTYR